MRIVNLESDRTARRALHLELFDAGFEVVDADCLDEGLALCQIVEPDILLLNLKSDEPAVDNCHVLRSEAPQAVIVALSENADPNQTIEILEAGADYCLAKDIYLPELVARLRAALRRSFSGSHHAADLITIGDIRLESGQRIVYRSGQPAHLSPNEFVLLHHLMTHPGFPISHESLMRVVWGAEHPGRIECLRSLVRQLRIKLNDNDSPRYLLTDSWIGYRFVDPGNAPLDTRHAGRAA